MSEVEIDRLTRRARLSTKGHEFSGKHSGTVERKWTRGETGTNGEFGLALHLINLSYSLGPPLSFSLFPFWLRRGALKDSRGCELSPPVGALLLRARCEDRERFQEKNISNDTPHNLPSGFPDGDVPVLSVHERRSRGRRILRGPL